MKPALIDAETARRWHEEGAAILVDVREPDERAREHVAGSVSRPLSGISLSAPIEDDRPVVFYCRTGNRTNVNAARLGELAARPAYVLDGGLDGWKRAGGSVAVNRNAPIELIRQVQITAGTLVVLGAVLAWLVSPWFILLAAGVGVGLVFAGLTGFCGMARLLGRLPWNRMPRDLQP